MFFFVQRPISEVPRPIATKLCHIIGIWLYFIIQIQKFRERSQKILGAKNVQNFGRFFATSDFDCEYLWKGLRYPNRNSKFFYVDSSRVLGNKSRELWSTNFRDLDVSLDPLKCTFLGILYLSPQGVLRPEIFTPATDWQRLPSAHPIWDGGPPKKF